jgi:SAM-dependent methyltransferase
VSQWTCAICGAHGGPRIRTGVRDYVTGDEFRLVQCERCGFAMTVPVPPSLDRYYPPRYRRFNKLAAAVLRRLYLRRVAGWRGRLPGPGLALEVGSGTGWMLGALRERGWRAIGSERAVGAAAAARAIARTPVFVGDLAAVRDAPFLDLVLMFHVLEHLADPVAALRAAASRLRPGGVLVLGLPNIASWQARTAGARWIHLDVPRHLCHFSPDSIERALTASGLRLVHIDFRSPEHDPLGWVQAALDRLGFEPGILLKLVMGTGRRTSGPVATLAALLLLPPLGAASLAIALVSWRRRAGAVMEVWAVREPPATTGRFGSDRR